MINVRTYRDEDYDAVKINLQEGGLFNDSVDTRETLRAKIQQTPDSILVATFNDQVVGNIYLIQDMWNSFIFRLAVRKDYRKRGIGSRLIEESERLLKEKGVRDVALFVRSDDRELIDYYEKRGYISMEKLHQCMYKEIKLNNR